MAAPAATVTTYSAIVSYVIDFVVVLWNAFVSMDDGIPRRRQMNEPRNSRCKSHCQRCSNNTKTNFCGPSNMNELQRRAGLTSLELSSRSTKDCADEHQRG